MIPYLLNVVFTILVLNFIKKVNVNNIVSAIDNRKNNELYYVLIVWVVFYSLKGTTGTDAGGYYNWLKNIYINKVSYYSLISTHRDNIFTTIHWLLAIVFNGYWIPACAIYAILLYFPIIYVIKHESINWGLSCLIYIYSMHFYFGFNGLRQGIAMGIMLIAYYSFLKKEKYILYFILVFVSIGFHSTSLLIIPIHILTLQKINSIKILIIILISILAYIFIVEWWGGLISILDDIGQKKIVSDYGTISEGMKNRGSVLRSLVAFAIFFIAIIKYKTLKIKFNDFDSDLWVLFLSLIGTVFISKFVYFARLTSYFNLGIIIIIPKLVFAFGEFQKKDFELIILILFFIHMVALLLHGESHLYPYVPVWVSESY